MQLITTRNAQGYRLDGERGDPSRPWLGTATAAGGEHVGAYLRPLRGDATVAQVTAIAKKLLEFRHPGVAPLLDVGLIDGTAAFIYGELPGTGLLASVAERLPLDETAAALLVYDILAPLVALQSAGLHHGDLHAERIVLRPDRSVGLLAPVPESLDLYGHPAACFAPAAGWP
jgi:serine/threonine protein kinase